MAGPWAAPTRRSTALGRSTAYRAALADLQAALDWARANHAAKVVADGSSYSASLVFLLAANNPGKIAGLMAFSPGEYLGGAHTVKKRRGQNERHCSVRFLGQRRGARSPSPALSSARCRQATKTQFVPKHAPHGASALRADGNPAGVEQAMAAVERFLNGLR